MYMHGQWAQVHWYGRLQDCENQASVNQEDEEVESEDETDIEWLLTASFFNIILPY